jgi:hypothetical protein
MAGLSALVALVLFTACSESLSRSHALLRFLDARRPSETQPTGLQIEQQLFRAMCRNLDSQAVPSTVALVGSSSLVNGVDESIANSGLAETGYRVANLGMTALLAYELPMLKDYFLPRGRRFVVLAYNPWMFSDTVHEPLLAERWNTGEALRLFRHRLSWRDARECVRGGLSEAFFLVRYGILLNWQLRRFVNGTLSVAAHAYDYPPGEERPAIPAVTTPVPLAQLSPSLRRWYVESGTLSDTIGWRGLSRFLDLATERGVAVVVVPVPLVPTESLRYGQGIDLAGIDGRAERLCRSRGATFVRRDRLPRFEESDFRDLVHLRDSGRGTYSAWMSAVLSEVVKGVPSPADRARR